MICDNFPKIVFRFLNFRTYNPLPWHGKSKKKKGKVISLHAMEAHGVREGIAPTHS
jgi:hypothetical protein